MRIAILGMGAMGSALAVPLASRGHEVHLWATPYDGRALEAMRRGEPHPALGVRVPGVGHGTGDLPGALRGARLVVLAVNSEGAPGVLRDALPTVPRGVPLVAVTKGLYGTPRGVVPLSALAGRRNYLTVGGPSIAREVARGVPTRVLLAGPGAGGVARSLSTPAYRLQPSPDRAGVELCAALKNVYAIAVGMAEGLRARRGEETLDNLKAALFARALEEMERVVRAHRGRPETVRGLAGAGDLEVTVRGGRNAGFGELLGRGLTPQGALEKVGSTVEGYTTTRLAHRLAREKRLKLTLLDAIYGILYRGRPADGLEI